MSNQPQNDDDFDHPHLDPDEQNDISSKMKRIVAIDNFTKEVEQEKVAQSRKPWWVQQAEDGDYMADGSDLQPYEPEEQ